LTYRISQRARFEVLEIANYIAADNEAAADQLLELLVQHFEFLGDNPYAGRRRDELRAEYRSFPVGQYIILYRVIQDGVEIMHVLHGRRDLDAALE
jgi:toxin ParE1/3/4